MSSWKVILITIATSVITTLAVNYGVPYVSKRMKPPKPRSDKVEVPLILGLSHAQADNVLGQAKLKLTVMERRPDPSFQKDTVCMQLPAKGTKLPEGSVVTAVISDGPPQKTVPSLVGMPVEQAKAKLKEAGLAAGKVTSKSHPTAPKDQVLSMTPAPGTKQKPGSAVDLTVSDGPVLGEVPKVTGRYYKDAKKKLTDAGFEVGTIKWRNSDSYDDYWVISQSVKPGTKAPKGTKINLVVNRE